MVRVQLDSQKKPMPRVGGRAFPEIVGRPGGFSTQALSIGDVFENASCVIGERRREIVCIHITEFGCLVYVHMTPFSWSGACGRIAGLVI